MAMLIGVAAVAVVAYAVLDADAVSGLNGKITFSRLVGGPNGNAEIIIMNPDGSTRGTSPNRPRTRANPAWSPDGTGSRSPARRTATSRSTHARRRQRPDQQLTSNAAKTSPRVVPGRDPDRLTRPAEGATARST